MNSNCKCGGKLCTCYDNKFVIMKRCEKCRTIIIVQGKRLSKKFLEKYQKYSEAINLLKKGRKILAIKSVRQVDRSGLREALSKVEEMENSCL